MYNETLSGSSGFVPSTPTVGKRIPEMFHTIGLSDSSNVNFEISRESTTSGGNEENASERAELVPEEAEAQVLTHL